MTVRVGINGFGRMGRLAVFGVVFAINSSVHSYLILAFTDADKVALNVGFYYMANAGGRLVGCLLSGLSYRLWGITGLSGDRIPADRRGRRHHRPPRRRATARRGQDVFGCGGDVKAD